MKKEMQNSARSNRRLRTVLVISLILLVFIISVAIAAIILDARHVRFYMEGEQEMTLEYGDSYVEPGVYAVSAGDLLGELDFPIDVRTQALGSADELGSFDIVYTARHLFRDYSTTRTVHVVDTKAPVIELRHDENYSPNWFTGYEEEGYTATDNHDGDITDKVTRNVETDRITYTVSDSSGNSVSVVRSLDFLNTAPQLTLNGSTEMTITAAMDFVDPGCTAVDMHGNDLSDYIEISGGVIPYSAGEYEITYTLVSESGESVSVVRTVTVLPVNNPDSVTPDGKVIYLTFDDGPGPYTPALLDVLKRYNAKATFFVTAGYPNYFNMIGRAVNEGHAVGVHSYSHNYKQIYASEQAFFEDFNAMNEIIYEQTGSYTKLCRFPGGSSNTVSRFNPGIMSRLANALTDLGYTYFDWNVSSGDAGETTKTEQVVKNVTEGCANRRVSVVLQHDIKDFSVNAVEYILNWGISNGYTFLALDQTSPDAHHGIAN